MNIFQYCRDGKGLLFVITLLLLFHANQVVPEDGEEAPMEGVNADGENMTPLEATLAAGEMTPMEGVNANGENMTPMEAILAAGELVPMEGMLAPGVDVMAGIAEMGAAASDGMPGDGINLLEEDREDFIRERMQEPNNAANRGKAPLGGS